jgi:hypothetical protein
MVTGLPHSPLAECCGADPAVYDEVGSYILLQLLHSFRSTDFFVVLSYYLYKQNRGRAWPPLRISGLVHSEGRNQSNAYDIMRVHNIIRKMG